MSTEGQLMTILAAALLALFAAMIALDPCDLATEATARAFVDEIRSNVDAWYAQPNTPATYAAFTARNGAIWRQVVAAGMAVHDEVQRLLRDEPREPE